MVRQDGFGIHPVGSNGEIPGTGFTQESKRCSPLRLADHGTSGMTDRTGVFFFIYPMYASFDTIVQSEVTHSGASFDTLSPKTAFYMDSFDGIFKDRP